MADLLPCYVSGKGMFATQQTWQFKTTVIKFLETSGLGYDTRFRYYQHQFPEMNPDKLARLVCDPIEYYDKDWTDFLQQHEPSQDKWLLATEFMLQRDNEFQGQAQLAIYCYDEAGFGSGVNTMRFITAGKPVLGFYNPAAFENKNLSNILQLEILFPEQVTLCRYHTIEDIRQTLASTFSNYI
jgi:hypothetical protein